MASGKSKQYGLILPSKGGVAPPKKKNVFGDDSDSDSDGGGDWVKKSLKREAQKSVQKRATKIQMKKALEEDPTVFQYDEIYDDLEQKKEEAKVEKKTVEKKPRYIQALLQTAEKRKKENERRVERQVQKEREEEGTQFADKESFVTSSYREKLEEFKKQEEEEKRMERLEAIGDVTRQNDLTGFYRHLYRQTMGESLPGANNSTGPGKEDISSSENVTSSQNTEETSGASGDKEHPSKGEERKKDRHYRQRRSSSTGSENSDDDKAVEVKKEKNIDADSDFTGSSSSDSDSENNEAGSGPKEGKVSNKRKVSKKSKEMDQSPKKKQKKDEDIRKDAVNIDKAPLEKAITLLPSVKEEKLSDNEGSKSDEKETGDSKTDSDANVSNVKVELEVKPKVNIWAKRTVGQALDDAVQRYYERKAERAVRMGRA